SPHARLIRPVSSTMARVLPSPAHLGGPQAPRVISSQPSTNPTPASHTTGPPPGPPPLPPLPRPAAPTAVFNPATGPLPLPSRPPAAATAIKPPMQQAPPPAAAPPKPAAPQPKKPSASPGSIPDTPPAPKAKKPVKITMEQVDAPGLLEYGMHLLTRSGVVVPTSDDQKRRRRSFACYNACVSPVHVVAGWAVAALSAARRRAISSRK
ncbi:hypothetical protein PENTCL1PPCAC_30331, partial [Pristionchus entomophagus]